MYTFKALKLQRGKLWYIQIDPLKDAKKMSKSLDWGSYVKIRNIHLFFKILYEMLEFRNLALNYKKLLKNTKEKVILTT